MLLETISMWLFSTFLCGYFGTFMKTKAKQTNDVLLFGFAFTLVIFLLLQLLGITDAYAVRGIHNVFLSGAAELERDLVASNSAIMLSQIQPHFLYNALSAIQALCGIDAQKAEASMEHFLFGEDAFSREGKSCTAIGVS